MIVKQKELSVAAIKEGSVIDHIPAGQGLKLVKLLKLADHHKKVTLGLNLPSRSMGYKDLIKIEDFEISSELAGQIAVFAPDATLVIIKEYAVVSKERVRLPLTIRKVLTCSNSRCITNHEEMTTEFSVNCFGKKVELRCKYCEKSFYYAAY